MDLKYTTGKSSLMVELEVSPLKILLGAIVAILTGIFFQMGVDIWSTAKDWILSPTVDLRFIISASLVILGSIGLVYAFRAMREEIVGVSAHLFFPKGTAVENRTVKFYKDSDFRHYYGMIVNHKTGINPSKAYYLRVNSYAWRILERQREIFYPEESNTEDRPNYPKWCADRNYVLIAKVPGRGELRESTSLFSDGKNLDDRLTHVEYRYFISPYDKLKKVSLPPRRIVLNWSTRSAYALDSWTMRLVVEGKIRGQTIMMLRPMLHYAQKWAKSRGFEWTDRLVAMEALLAKKNDDSPKPTSK